MRWQGVRLWAALAGPLFAVLIFAVGPAALKAAKLPWPPWAPTAIAATGGVLLLVANPLLKEALNQLITERRRQKKAVDHLPGGLRRVRKVHNRSLLGIHPAIPLPEGSDLQLSTDFPTYVAREVDNQLLRELGKVATEGGFVLLTGPAACGKTRCLYEAVNILFGDWRLAMPANGRQLTELVDSGIDLTRTVVWLDETQDFVEDGRLTAETVGRLLARPTHPVVLVGTMWREHYERLSSSTGKTAAAGLNRDARRILRLATQLPMPEAFGDDDRHRVESAAGTDPRLCEAFRQQQQRSDMSLTQTLAATPELIQRWEQANDPYGKAVLTAAVYARCCGYQEPLPPDLLQTLAEACLSQGQRATAGPEWFASAVAWATDPVRGSVAPLVPEAAEVDQLDGYRVTDILVHRAQHRPRTTPSPVPDELWEVLIDHAPPKACTSIARAAQSVGRSALAERAYKRGADVGDPDAVSGLLFVLLEQAEEIIASVNRLPGDVAYGGNELIKVVQRSAENAMGTLDRVQRTFVAGPVEGVASALGAVLGQGTGRTPDEASHPPPSDSEGPRSANDDDNKGADTPGNA
ncbi:hypothetical protein [Streptomyces olivaceiscleroticus]|uniref:AAA+ ATPase domain-containing protein n=1 Tax=Streptomyces olivaceiscleroticus TaxID=68245 RepID=A0ABN0ZTX0_9ACTN